MYRFMLKKSTNYENCETADKILVKRLLFVGLSHTVIDIFQLICFVHCMSSHDVIRSQFFILSLVPYDANSEGVSDVLMCTIILRYVCVCVFKGVELR